MDQNELQTPRGTTPEPVKERSGAAAFVLTALISAALAGGAAYFWMSVVLKDANVRAAAEADRLRQELADLQLELEGAAEETAVAVARAEVEEAETDPLVAPLEGGTVEEGASPRYTEPLGFNFGEKGIVFIRDEPLGKLLLNGDHLNAFAIPVHPETEDIVFFSTQRLNEDYSRSVNRLFSYNWRTGALRVLYDETETRILRTVGRDGSKLLVLADGPDNSPGPCWSHWAGGAYFSLELSDTDAGLQPYEPPEAKTEEGRKAVEACEAELEEAAATRP
jgi:hypothetical protein